uniref:Uncharacterized protein n=1 Tax=Zonotrichia albicollis TaxID=44394 RepID=A0A8D2MTS4_ZONAL
AAFLPLFLLHREGGWPRNIPCHFLHSLPFPTFPQVLSLLIPSQLQRVAQRALHRLFHTRSCLFVVLHVALQAAVFGEYTWEVFVYCWELQFHLLLLLLPYLLLAANLGCLLLCSRANPGTVTKSNAASLAKVYAYDGVLFQRGLVCPTCSLEKPARSKHCSCVEAHWCHLLY